VTSERLLGFISQLQSERTIASGRRMLLAFVHESCGPRVVALFALDQQAQEFVLLDYVGQLPVSSQCSSPSTENVSTHKELERIPSNGLLTSALLNDGLLSIPDVDSDTRTLPEERRWACSGERLILSRVSTGTQPDSVQGALLMSFEAEANKAEAVHTERPMLSEEGESDLRVCIALLSAYLSRDDSNVRDQYGSTTIGHSTQPPLALQNGSYSASSAEMTGIQYEQMAQQDASPETIYSITSMAELYQMGLAAASDLPVEELYQHILTHMRNVVRAKGACLLLYRPAKQQFIVGALQGEALPCSVLIPAMRGPHIERLAMRGPGETLTPMLINGQRLLIVTLSYNSALMGIAALSVGDENTLIGQRSLLLSYMGNMVAIILRNHDLRIMEQKTAIDRERNRIARDIHDGVAQQLALLLLKIEYVQRLLERSSAQQLPVVQQELKRSHAMLKASLQDLRHGFSSIKPVQLEQLGLEQALQSLFTEFKINTPGCEIATTIVGIHKIPENLETPVYRLIQEALNNISKHAYASLVTIHIRVLPTLLIVEASDNGRGFHPEQATTIDATSSTDKAVHHIGLQSMRERVNEAGGTWEIQSRPGVGTTIRARFPLIKSSMKLTNREREVLQLIIEGLTNRDIAGRLSISVETVKSHTHHIMQKMQVKDRTQAAVIATRQGLL
jgi:signal transduction histidine kinase